MWEETVVLKSTGISEAEGDLEVGSVSGLEEV